MNARTLTRDVVRAIDRRAMEELGLPGVVLMENAGRGAAQVALRLLEGAAPGRVLILCGPGNNGGDGYVVARHLANAGRDVLCAATVEGARQHGDAATMRGVWERAGGALLDARDPDLLRDAGPGAPALVVDALLGTGFSGEEVRSPLAEAIDLAARCAARGARVLALDVPSGLDCDTGRAARPTVRADATVTFVASKPGLARAPGLAGEVVVVPIGVPAAWLERVIAEESGPGGEAGGQGLHFAPRGG